MILRVCALSFFLLFSLAACQPSLKDHAKIKPFQDPRDWPEGVVPAGESPEIVLSESVLRRGRERYDIHCQVCHGLDGDGDGIAVLRGFPRPPSFHAPSLRAHPVAHFYDVITNGKGRMFGMKNRVPERDRRAIAFYVRALQLQRHFPENRLSPDELARLERDSP